MFGINELNGATIANVNSSWEKQEEALEDVLCNTACTISYSSRNSSSYSIIREPATLIKPIMQFIKCTFPCVEFTKTVIFPHHTRSFHLVK